MNNVFLIASERSGSNLITQIMNSHKDFYGATPTHLFRLFLLNKEKFGNLNSDKNWKKLISKIIEGYNLKIGLDWTAKFTEKEILDNVKDRNIISVLNYLYFVEGKLRNKKRAFIKEVKTHKILPLLLFDNPNIQFVYQIRDPRDMALSWKKSPTHRYDIMRAANVWKEDQKRGIELINLFANEEKISFHTYENLTKNTENVLNELTQFLKIEYDENMLSFHKSEKTNKSSEASVSWKNVNKKMMSDNSKKYLKQLTEDEIRYIENICFKEMEFFGYKLEYPLLNQSEFKELRNKLEPFERYEKLQYQSLNEIEKVKRKKWMEFYHELELLK